MLVSWFLKSMFSSLCIRRVLELFTQDWSLSKRLRMPALSHRQKVHNVELAFQVLKVKGVDLKEEHGE